MTLGEQQRRHVKTRSGVTFAKRPGGPLLWLVPDPVCALCGDADSLKAATFDTPVCPDGDACDERRVRPRKD